jgi:hypothetical protein
MNGIHSHKCKSCGEVYECAKVTHCKETYLTICYACRYSGEAKARLVPTIKLQ